MSYDLCLLADLKIRLKIPSTNTNADAELQALISQCSTDFHNACHRVNMFTQTYTEQRDGQGGRKMVLLNTPIQSVTSLTISNFAVPQSADGVQPGFVFDSTTLKLVHSVFIAGYGNVQIVYAAGFGPQSALTLGDPNFPDDIELAVLDWCAKRYKIRQNEGMTAKHLATGESVSFDKNDMPPNVKDVIERYKRRVPIL